MVRNDSSVRQIEWKDCLGPIRPVVDPRFIMVTSKAVNEYYTVSSELERLGLRIKKVRPTLMPHSDSRVQLRNQFVVAITHCHRIR
jgi:hypothetical protein